MGEMSQKTFSIKVDESGKVFQNDDDADPRSCNYKRTLVRPKISVLWFAIRLVSPICFSYLLLRVLNRIGLNQFANILIIVSIMLIYFSISAKRMIIDMIKLYQRFAPPAIRMKCRFEPSCSQYMILSIKKYGVVRGLLRGIKRLCRCNINGGGFDDP